MLVMKVDEMNIPHLFRCPISLDLFTDPVTLCTGQTYDRSNIEKWLSAGNLTCPVTMQKLHDTSLVPNHTLKHLIQQWLSMENRIEPQHLRSIDPSLSLATLKRNLESQESTFTTRIEALGKVRILSQELGWRRSCLVQLGFIQMLLGLVFGNLVHKEAKLSKEGLELAEQALNCVLNLLPYSDLTSLSMLEDSSHFASFLALLKHGTTKIKMNLCSLLETISSSSETRELCLLLGQCQCLLQELVNLLHPTNEASEAGCKALSTLCSLESNRENVIREGGVDGLLLYLSSANKHQSSIALTTLELLVQLHSGKQALVDNPNGINILVKMVFRVSDHEGSESAVNSLLNICYDSMSVREVALCAGVLTQLLLLLQSQCGCRVKNKAMLLLKMLRSMGTKKDTSNCDLQCGLVDT